jgi:glycosyltransferase involved in cell wall biosynthesis|tara:strand:+ start:391 stop:1563 length:1173 start_codon:yes stop_codon:yes gene_type:complete
MKKKLKIVNIISSLNPIYGGPSATFVQTSKKLSESRFDVTVLTYDNKNFIKKNNNKFKIIRLNTNHKGFNVSLKLIKWIRANKNNYDYFLFNGVWGFDLLLARIFLKNKYFVFIHGSLDPYFGTEFFKKIKKKLYWFITGKKNLLYSRGILVSGKNEVKMLKKTYVNMSGIKIHNVGYSFYLINKEKKVNYKNILYKKFPQLKNKKFFLFIGRIHNKKGCDILLKAILKIKNLKNYCFLIAGFNVYKNEYEKYILDIIKKNKKLNDIVIATNFLQGGLKVSAIKLANATILPSRGENFGVSVVESIALSTIPLITNKVGLHKEIKRYNAGYVYNDDVRSISKMINNFINIEIKMLKIMKKNCLKCYNEVFNIKNKDNDLLKLFNKINIYN